MQNVCHCDLGAVFTGKLSLFLTKCKCEVERKDISFFSVSYI